MIAYDSAKKYVETLHDNQLSSELLSAKRIYNHKMRLARRVELANETYHEAQRNGYIENARWFARVYWHIIDRMRTE